MGILMAIRTAYLEAVKRNIKTQILIPADDSTYLEDFTLAPHGVVPVGECPQGVDLSRIILGETDHGINLGQGLTLFSQNKKKDRDVFVNVLVKRIRLMKGEDLTDDDKLANGVYIDPYGDSEWGEWENKWIEIPTYHTMSEGGQILDLHDDIEDAFRTILIQDTGKKAEDSDHYIRDLFWVIDFENVIDWSEWL